MEKEDKFPPVLKHTEHYGVSEKPNAHLIEAAPELYRALEAMCETCNKYNLEILTPEYEKATRALARARGEETPSE